MTSLPTNSVSAAQLRDGAVANPKLAKHAVTGTKVADGSLTGKQINTSTLGLVRNLDRDMSQGHTKRLAIVGPFKISASCRTGYALLRFRRTDGAPIRDVTYWAGSETAASPITIYDATFRGSHVVIIGTPVVSSGKESAVFGTAMLNSGGGSPGVQVDFHLIADYEHASLVCNMRGTALEAS